MQKPIFYESVDACVDAVIERIGKHIVLAIPLGIGKPNPLANGFFKKAKQNPTIHLKIITALTLEKPQGSSELEQRFLGPFVERVFGDYPDLDYALAIRHGELPANIEVAEFFFKPGGYLNVPASQQNYISSNYTHVVRDLMHHGVNVIAQMVAKKTIDGHTYYSLGSNPDLTLDLLPLLAEAKKQGRETAALAQVNNRMPFMYHDAMLEPAHFDGVIDDPADDFTLFGPPNLPVQSVDYKLGLNASALIKDGGTLQIGIGSLGDAIVYASKLRHKNNGLYKKVLTDVGVSTHFAEVITEIGDTDPFTKGLYGSTEMFVNGFWHLYESDILKRRVYDHVSLQRLLNQGKITETVTPEILTTLLEHHVIQAQITENDFHVLQHFGLFKDALRFDNGAIITPGGLSITADLENTENREKMFAHCLGTELNNGILLHAGFFLGPQSFYQALCNLSEDKRKDFFMTSVNRVNQLYGNEELARLQRKQARFFNTTIMVTLLGAAVSDGLENGEVISGVGGQYNFVDMAHALTDGRSILMLRSTRKKGGVLQSNIVWNYGHITIPRHLRDLVVTEYGIADLRGKSDKDVIAALLNIADSNFQDGLLEKAKKFKKIPEDYQIPPEFRNNTVERLEAEMTPFKNQGLFPDFPFGHDFTEEEIVLGKVLKNLKTCLGSIGSLMKSLFQAIEVRHIPETALPYLARLGLDKPAGWKDEAMQRLIVAELIAGGHLSDEESEE
jgi:acyl-CoA hydrolase